VEGGGGVGCGCLCARACPRVSPSSPPPLPPPQSLEYRLSSLRDLMAFALLIVFATLLKHLERLPVLGPKLCAITAVLCDSVVIVFVAFIFLVSAACVERARAGVARAQA